MTNKAVRIENLVKTFGRTRALDGLGLTVERGQVHGFLGPNGAGKSTTLRILLGQMRADSGRVEVLGRDPWSDPTLHENLAYVPGDVALWPNLTGGEVIDVLTRMRGGVDPARKNRLIEQFQLDPTKKCRSYSTGNRQKVALVAALAADVELLILDEPTAGLDPLMEEVFRSCVADAAAEGCTVLLSSHILGEVEAICDQVTIVRQGSVAESGSLAALRHLTRTVVDAELVGDPGPLMRLDGVHDADINGDTFRCEVDTEWLDPLLARIASIGTRRLVIAPPTLEELFLRHYEGVRWPPSSPGRPA
ncbi:ATP-binding cassette domain-containing protein [Ruania zhangjianzhongii]|uniref:ABC transporter ATP-binding protein n=1 Tax=Ruania zhangjianzhongii TaxID=2603206 RepID=UPI0011C86BB2|nr:ABC transporter ATP-binding protein [Ruania zhangjianzhongii]